MTTTVKDIIKTFEELPLIEQRELASEILRRSVAIRLPAMTDEELALNAEEIFLELDRLEAADGES